jgi:hypothetical protein
MSDIDGESSGVQVVESKCAPGKGPASRKRGAVVDDSSDDEPSVPLARPVKGKSSPPWHARDVDDITSVGGSDSEAESDDSSDPVEAVFKVYLNRDPEDEAFMLRFPTMPVQRITPQFREAKFKPANELLELRYNTWESVSGAEKHKHFDLGLGQGMSSAGEAAKQVERRKMQVLRSERLNDSGRTYAMGVVDQQRKTVHLVPLCGLLEMKPVLQGGFLDNAGGAELVVEEPAAVVKSAKDQAPKAVEVINFRKESARQQQDAAKLTFAKLKETEGSEPWLRLAIYSRSDAKTERVYQRHKRAESADAQLRFSDLSGAEEEEEEEAEEQVQVMEAQSDGDEPMRPARRVSARARRVQALQQRRANKFRGCLEARTAFRASAVEYLDAIAPQKGAAGGVVVLDGPEGADGGRAAAKKAGFDDEVRQKLCKRLAMRLDEILPPSHTNAKHSKRMLELLPQIAVLVRGVWVVNSDTYCRTQYGEVFAADGGGGSGQANHLRRRVAVRDILLWLLLTTEDGAVKRETVSKYIKLPAGDLLEAVNSCCKQDKETKSWRLVAKDDHKFIKAHPKVVAAEREKLMKRFVEALVLLGVSEAKANDFAQQPQQPQQQQGSAAKAPDAPAVPAIKHEKGS